MAKNIDYTGDDVKNSIAEAMNKVIDYYKKNWREGNELKVRDYTQEVCCVELLKYMSYSQRDTLMAPLFNYVKDTTSIKYTKIFERWLLQYGPYIMTLALEYASVREWRNRYNVSDKRRAELIDEAYTYSINSLKKMGLWK